jgi:hypothetical protein
MLFSMIAVPIYVPTRNGEMLTARYKSFSYAKCTSSENDTYIMVTVAAIIVLYAWKMQGG